MRIGGPALREAIQQQTSGIRQTEHFGELVAGFARRVVKRASQQGQRLRCVYPINMGVTARNEQAQQRVVQLMFKADGQQMGVEVVDGDQRLVARQSQALGERHAHEQRPEQARPTGRRDDVHIGQRQPRAAHQFVVQRAQKTVVLTGSQLGNDAAEQRVHVHLRRQHGLHAFPVPDQRQRGFITRGFDTKTKHNIHRIMQKKARNERSTRFRWETQADRSSRYVNAGTIPDTDDRYFL